MKSKTFTWFTVMTLFAVLGMSIRVYAQEKQERDAQHHHYKLIDLGTFGGPNSGVNIEPFQNVINSKGTVVGGADTSMPTPEPGCYNPIGNPDCFVSHAFVWRGNSLKELGTLPGGNFSFATAINQRGQIAGLSENDQIDPFSGNPEFHAVLWENDKILDLGTFGGVSSFAATLNNRGQVTGVALNDVPDPFSMLGTTDGTTLTQTRGFLWQDGKMQDLKTLGGPDTWAVFVNDRGQVAGTSYISYVIDPNTGTPPVGVFLSENGKMKDLGSLGGDNGLLPFYNIVNGLNNRGQVVGMMVAAGDQFVHAFLWNGEELLDLGALGGNGSIARGINDAGEVMGLATLPGDQVNHGFLWRNGVMTDLGTLGGDPCSDALAINSKGQVVGASQSAAGGCSEWTTAFLSENGGPIVDLNSLVPSGSGVHLFAGFWANDAGEIVAGGNPPVCDTNATCGHAYVLIPCDENHPDVAGCDYSLVDTPIGEVRDNLTQREGTSSGNSKLESGPAQMFRSPSSDESNSLNRFRHRLALAPSLKNPQPLSSTISGGLAITSGAPLNGKLGASYGPSTTEYLKCYASPVLGWHQVCTPCSSFSSGCVSLLRCTGLFPSPCVKTEVVYLGVVLTATGGISPYEWSASGLPSGLSLNFQKGLISGIPITAGIYNLTVNVHDSALPAKSASAHYNILISP